MCCMTERDNTITRSELFRSSRFYSDGDIDIIFASTTKLVLFENLDGGGNFSEYRIIATEYSEPTHYVLSGLVVPLCLVQQFTLNGQAEIVLFLIRP